MNRALYLAFAVSLGAACSAPVSSAPAVAPQSTAKLLSAMAALTGFAAEPLYLDGWVRKIDRGEATLDAYIDEILSTQRFSSEIMPALLFGAFVSVRNYYAVPSGFILKHPDQAAGPLYLRAPCAASEGIGVHPWWDLDATVSVCPDTYQPEKWTLTAQEQSYRTKMLLSCDSQVGSPELETKPLCGCGPNLIRCVRDEEQYNELNRSLMDEVKYTTQYVVQHDLPMASLFTGNETFRDRNAQLYYLRQKIGAKEIADGSTELATLSSWPAEGMWAPREELSPGQHAGVLTAPQILHWLPDRRQRQRGFYEMMWCNLRNSFGATTHKVLELNTTGNIAFVHDSWEKLAHTELCTNCHARLDYGFQFFLGYPDSRASTYFTPSLQSGGSGELYGRDITDMRGEAARTPAGFAKLATEQPEFGACMTSHFASYVLGDQATNADEAAISAAVAKVGTFKAPMRVALQLYAQKWRQGVATSPPAEGAIAKSAPGPKGGVVVNPALHATLGKLCNDCHDKTPYTSDPDGNEVPFDFTGGELPRSLMVAMVDRVAFGMMPKDAALDEPEREATVELLVDTLWPDPAARSEARHYYLGRGRGLPAQQVDNAFNMIDQRARARPNLQWGALERGIWSDQATMTPGFLTMSALEALRACTAAGKTGLDECLARTTSLDTLSRWPR